MHGHVVHERLELLVAGHEVGLAVHFDEHAHLRSRVDVVVDHAFVGGTRGLLVGRRHALLAQDLEGLVHIALRLGQGHLAVHDARAAGVAQLLDQSSINTLSSASIETLVFNSASGSHCGRRRGRLCHQRRLSLAPADPGQASCPFVARDLFGQALSSVDRARPDARQVPPAAARSRASPALDGQRHRARRGGPGHPDALPPVGQGLPDGARRTSGLCPRASRRAGAALASAFTPLL